MSRKGDRVAQEQVRSGSLLDFKRRQERRKLEARSKSEAYANAYERGDFHGTWRDLPKSARDVLAERGW